MENISYNIIKSDEKGEITNEEIKRVIKLMNYESSDRLAILEDLVKLLKKDFPRRTLLEIDFLSTSIKIFEDEKEGDERIINLLVTVIKKIESRFFNEKECIYKSIDAIDSLYNIMISYSERKIKVDSIKAIITIVKKYPSDVMDCYNIKNSYKYVLPSASGYSCEEKKIVLILFKEMIKEGLIKKGEGLEMVEEMIFIIEEVERKKNIVNLEEELLNEYQDFVRFAKEKGFEGKLFKNKNDILASFLFTDWKALCEEEDNCSCNKSEGIIEEQEKEKIKNFSNNILDYPFDVQIKFIDMLKNCLSNLDESPDGLVCFKGRKNGFFLYNFLPLFFKNYHFEEKFSDFLYNIQDNHKDITPCYEYIIILNNELIDRFLKESLEEIESNEGTAALLLFFWSVIKEDGKKEKETDYLINLTVKVFHWLGRIEVEEKIKEKKKDSATEEYNDVEEKNKLVNRKEMMMCVILEIVSISLLNYSNEDVEKIKKDGRIGKVLLEIIRNHLENESCLIQKGNKKRIIEYLIYSYREYNTTCNLLSIPSHYYPFSNETIAHILDKLRNFLSDDEYKKLNKENIIKNVVLLLNNYIDIIKIIAETNVKEEIERDICLKWNIEIITKIKDKNSLNWLIIRNILFNSLDLFCLSSFDYENNRIVKRIIDLFFYHNNNNIHNNMKEKEKCYKDIKEIKLLRPFLINRNSRDILIILFLSLFTNCNNYSIFDIFYLVRESKEGCNIIYCCMKDLTGEIVDRIQKEEGNNSLKERRRRFERERIDDICIKFLESLKDLIKYTFKDRNNVYLGSKRNKDSYIGKEKEIKEDKNYILEMIEEEDLKECFILFLKHKRAGYNSDNNKLELSLSTLSKYSEEILSYIISL